MKKLNLRSNVLQGEVLTRSQLKKVMGGNGSVGGSGCKTASCTFTDGNGNTSTGTCGGKGDASGVPYGTITMECFCNTSSHTTPTSLGSNGGVSRCYN